MPRAAPDQPRTAPDQRSTRERILDVALELFIDQGYDKTSLREVAERMGFTKAALYYHFPSKADMLAALHDRMHSLMDEPLAVLGEGPVTVGDFEHFLNVCIEEMQANQKLFVLHRVNQAAIGKIHIEGHGDRHIDLEERAQRIFSDASVSEPDRVRMAASFAAAMLTPMIVGAWFPSSGSGGFKQTLKDIVHQVLQPTGPAGRGRPGPTPAPGPVRRPSSGRTQAPSPANGTGANGTGTGVTGTGVTPKGARRQARTQAGTQAGAGKAGTGTAKA